MIEMFALDVSIKLFFHLMVSFAFFIGVILMISSEAFEGVNRVLLREYGIKTKMIPPLESTMINTIDKFVMKNRVFAGMLISIFSFFLLIFFK